MDFNNTEVAFRYKSTADLKRAQLLFAAIANPSLVKMGSAWMQRFLKWRLPVRGLIKNTVFAQFCGGETRVQCDALMDKLHAYGVQSILDYGVEGKERESDFNHACEVAVETCSFAKSRNTIPFTVFKPSAMGRIACYEAVQRGDVSPEVQREWEDVVKRYHLVAQAAVAAGVPVMIDAEEFWIQGAVDDIALELMREYNVKKPVVYTTLQMYRHDRLAYLEELIQKAEQEGFYVGVKLVRGAYMEKERERAAARGYADPIQPSKAATDADYDKATQRVLEKLDRVWMCAGTHNEESVRAVANGMTQMGVAPDDERVFFSQLFGMSDHLSFNLAEAGYRVVKYLPYGPVEDVMPYLIRRAEENSSVEGQTGRELQLIRKELKRRSKQT